MNQSSSSEVVATLLLDVVHQFVSILGILPEARIFHGKTHITALRNILIGKFFRWFLESFADQRTSSCRAHFLSGWVLGGYYNVLRSNLPQ
jgi:hypothetical protein